MGLLLSILISCVGVAELLAFYANVRRRIEPHHQNQQESLRGVAQNCYKDLEAEKRRITKEISKLERNYTLEDYTDYTIDAPTTAINATEIEDEPYVISNECIEGEKHKGFLKPNFDQQFWNIKKSRSKENLASKKGYTLERRRSKSESDLNACRELVLRAQNEIVVSNFWKSPFQTLLEYKDGDEDDEDTLSCNSTEPYVKSDTGYPTSKNEYIKPDLKVLDSVDGIKNKKISNSDESLHQFKLKRKLKSSTIRDEGGVVDQEHQGVAPGSSKDKEPFWLIFSGEYTKAMNKDWHGQHFCCWQCDESLTGQRYVLRDEHPYCVSCYESVFANGCEKCNKIIGIDSKDLSYKDKHWHEACFLCTACSESLVDKQFGSRSDRIYCGRCYDEKFASRCDGCGEIFRAGTKKMEYKTRQWHEKCFCCVMCKTPIGTQSFIPREQEIYCAKCYEEKYATRCIKCNKVITSGGVTYKNEPWHRECFTCTNCQMSLAGARFTSRDDKPYCADCFGELFAKRCFACRKPITGIGGTKFISFEDRHWHNDCFFCASCRTSLVGKGFITDQEDIICPECAKQKLM